MAKAGLRGSPNRRLFGVSRLSWLKGPAQRRCPKPRLRLDERRARTGRSWAQLIVVEPGGLRPGESSGWPTRSRECTAFGLRANRGLSEVWTSSITSPLAEPAGAPAQPAELDSS